MSKFCETGLFVFLGEKTNKHWLIKGYQQSHLFQVNQMYCYKDKVKHE